MENDALRKILNRFKISDFNEICKRWPYLRNRKLDSILRLKRKIELVNRVLEIAKKDKIRRKDIAQLDLIYVHKYSKKLIWTVFQLQKIVDGTTTKALQTPAEFSSRLHKALSLYFKVDVCVRVESHAFWVRVRMCPDGPTKAASLINDVTYFVYHPHAPYLLAAKMKAAEAEYIMQAFVDVLDCKEVEELHLRGHCVNSLGQLVLNRHSQGSFSQYRLNQVDPNPLSGRTLTRKQDLPSRLSDDIVYENRQERERDEETVAETFGPNEQPTLEKIEYQMLTKFCGHPHAPGMSRDGPFHCRVRFEGPNVIEGLRNLASAGAMSVPLKTHLAKIHTSARSVFMLKNKDRRQRSSQTSTSSQHTPASQLLSQS
ncbi:hypothetical protein NP493_1277g00026 [Ridgeia piscesae]|uniref:Centromere protein N n=1 Tax=Ridgeia piscesae TaxID=27915 RepID=A0AAD9KAE4_RIDPI|nr:hypothetical protein NP493_1277g00026 [Ridgeia piscesae]